MAVGFHWEADFAFFLAFADAGDVGAAEIFEAEVGDFADSKTSVKKEADEEPLGEVSGLFQNVFDFGGGIDEAAGRGFAEFLDQNEVQGDFYVETAVVVHEGGEVADAEVDRAGGDAAEGFGVDERIEDFVREIFEIGAAGFFDEEFVARDF